jgi:2-amino-4-hydroxy-6-hydroxymethyldihydropteridine diphosphokinase
VVRYWIGLGSNLGDRLATLRAAAKGLDKIGSVTHRSRVFAASAVGGPPQPPFLNAAVVLVTELGPAPLLAACQKLEAQLGRDRAKEVRWGPRTADVDILLAGERGELIVHEPDLEIPHPRLHERSFALATLIDLEGALMHPTQARPLKALLAAANHQGHPVAPTGDFL